MSRSTKADRIVFHGSRGIVGPREIDLHALGRRLIEARESCGWGSRETDIESHVGIGTVSRLESARRPEISVRSLARIASALGVRFDWLVHGHGPMRELRPGEEVSDPKAGVFLAHVDRLPGLREWLQENPAEVRLSTLVRGIEAYPTLCTRTRSDGQPLGGWSQYFADLDALVRVTIVDDERPAQKPLRSRPPTTAGLLGPATKTGGRRRSRKTAK